MNSDCIKSILSVLLLLTVVSSASADMLYNKKTGRLIIKGDGEPIKDILTEISSKTGITISSSIPIEGNNYATFENATIDTVLKKLLKPMSYALLYKKGTVIAVVIFERSKEASGTSEVARTYTPSAIPTAPSPIQTAPRVESTPVPASNPSASISRQEQFKSYEERLKQREEMRAKREAERRAMMEQRNTMEGPQGMMRGGKRGHQSCD